MKGDQWRLIVLVFSVILLGFPGRSPAESLPPEVEAIRAERERQRAALDRIRRKVEVLREAEARGATSPSHVERDRAEQAAREQAARKEREAQEREETRRLEAKLERERLATKRHAERNRTLFLALAALYGALCFLPFFPLYRDFIDYDQKRSDLTGSSVVFGISGLCFIGAVWMSDTVRFTTIPDSFLLLGFLGLYFWFFVPGLFVQSPHLSPLAFRAASFGNRFPAGVARTSDFPGRSGAGRRRDPNLSPERPSRRLAGEKRPVAPRTPRQTHGAGERLRGFVERIYSPSKRTKQNRKEAMTWPIRKKTATFCRARKPSAGTGRFRLRRAANSPRRSHVAASPTNSGATSTGSGSRRSTNWRRRKIGLSGRIAISNWRWIRLRHVHDEARDREEMRRLENENRILELRLRRDRLQGQLHQETQDSGGVTGPDFRDEVDKVAQKARLDAAKRAAQAKAKIEARRDVCRERDAIKAEMLRDAGGIMTAEVTRELQNIDDAYQQILDDSDRRLRRRTDERDSTRHAGRGETRVPLRAGAGDPPPGHRGVGDGENQVLGAPDPGGHPRRERSLPHRPDRESLPRSRDLVRDQGVPGPEAPPPLRPGRPGVDLRLQSARCRGGPTEDLSFLVDAMVWACAAVWGGEDTNQTPLLKRCLRAVFHALAEKTPHPPRSGVPRRIPTIPTGLRRRLTRGLADFIMQAQWDTFNAEKPREFRDEFGSTMNRLLEFLASERIRRIFGQREGTIRLREVMDQGGMLLVNLSSGRALSEANASLLGALLVNDLFLKARGRPKGSRPFYVYIDECHRFVSEDIGRILDEGRQFGLHLILAHQHLAQLKKAGEAVYGAILTDARTKVVFGGLAPEEAEILADFLYLGRTRLRGGEDEPQQAGRGGARDPLVRERIHDDLARGERNDAAPPLRGARRPPRRPRGDGARAKGGATRR